jgi:hypothetical protein
MAIALLKPHWHSLPTDGESRNVTPDVTYEPTPEWLQSVAADEFARDDLGEHAQTDGAHCLCIRYEADPPLPADGKPGREGLSEHVDARRTLQTAVMMLWLSRRTSFGYDTIVVANHDDEGWTWREITTHDVRRALPSYQAADIEPNDFEAAFRYGSIFKHAKPQGTVRMANHALMMALSQSDWPLRYLSLWLALESLFGPEDARETTFRLCQRTALFLVPRGPEAVRLFKEVSESYRWRSKVAHGLRLQKLEANRSLELLEGLEELVHRSLRRILGNEEVFRTFDSSRREEFLDHLALT